ncbi:MAG: class I SAM-dependent methyltransferase [Deltaproteobacteria bacterium]|nr:class I SAM-dependent methyltransferase [Deltaproteobacteria bacterium]
MGRLIQELAYSVIREDWPKLTEKRILDVGAGHGRLAQKLALCEAKVTALDFKPSNAPVGKVKCVCHDLNQATLPFETASFDILVSTEVLEHLKAPFCILTEMVRVLKPGGMLVLTMPNYWNIKYRVKYLLTGHFQRPIMDDPSAKRGYLTGTAPHINSITYSTLRAVLMWEGCDNFSLRAPRVFNWGQRIGYLPFLLLIRLSTCFQNKTKRLRYCLNEINGRAALLGRSNVLIRCFKQTAEYSDREVKHNLRDTIAVS